MEKQLATRSGNACELCTSTENLSVYVVPPTAGVNSDQCVHVCATCKSQISGETEADSNHWRCLNDSMWSEVEAVKVVAWRMLNQLKNEGWSQDLLDMMYLEDSTLNWAKEGQNETKIKHIDSNGVELHSGDSVVLIKDLKVKGGGFTAKRGTAVRNITLVHDNAEHIEGKVDGQRIVILTQYVKK